jgi:hypothetical protein
MPLLTELIACTLPCYKDFAPTELVIGFAESVAKSRLMFFNSLPGYNIFNNSRLRNAPTLPRDSIFFRSC